MTNNYRPILDSLFNEPNVFIAHHLESYNNFINFEVRKIVRQFNNTVFEINRANPTENVKYIKGTIFIHDISIGRPKYDDSDDKTGLIFPDYCRNNNSSYQSKLYVLMNYKIELLNASKNRVKLIESKIKKEEVGELPVMLKSNLCNLDGLTKDQLVQVNEDPYDFGAYFIINGTEKYIVPQESMFENYVRLFKNKKEKDDYSTVAHVKCLYDTETEYKHSEVKVLFIKKSKEIVLTINPIFDTKKNIPINIIFRALGIETDKEITEYCISNIDDDVLLEMMRASLLWKDKNELSYKTRDSALLYLANNTIQNTSFLKDKTDHDKQIYIQGLIDKYLFPHVPDNSGTIKIKKARYLGYIVRQVLLAQLDLIPDNDRDDLGNKRIVQTGPLLAQLFRPAFSSAIDKLKTNIRKELEQRIPQTDEGYKDLITRHWNKNLIISPIRSSLSTGLWKTGGITRNGVAQILNRKSRMEVLDALRATYIQTPSQVQISEMRRLHPSTMGYLDPLDTPEGKQTGIVKHLSITTKITLYTNPEIIYEVLTFALKDNPNYFIKSEDIIPTESWKLCPILINGDLWASTEFPNQIIEYLKKQRREMKIDIFTSLIWNIDANEIRIMTDAGRLVRPLLIVKNNKLLINDKVIENLNNPDPFKKMTWEQLIQDAYIEYLDTHECQYNCLIAINEDTLKDAGYNNYTHCEISNVCMLGTAVGLIPFSEHNQAPRNLFQASMLKQSIDIYCTTYPIRMDTVAHVLHYPSRPLITTTIADWTSFNVLPSGSNVMVAVAMFSGYNQEDSIMLNRSSINRGLFSTTTFKTYKDESKNDEIFIKPDPNTVKGMKNNSNYDKLSEYGIVLPGTVVVRGDVLIGKVKNLEKNDANNSVYDKKDISIVMKEPEGIVDSILCDKNDEGYEIYKVKIRILKIPIIGDKCCLSSDHDVLTTKGWKPINEITLEDKVATLKDGQFIEYNKPTELFEYDHDGDMYSLQSQFIDVLATMNHKMYIQFEKKDKYELVEAKDIVGKMVKYKKSGINTNTDYDNFKPLSVPLDPFLVFFGLFMAEGWGYNKPKSKYVGFATNKERVRIALEAACKEMNIKISKDDPRNKWYIRRKDFVEYFAPLSVGAVNKSLPKWCFKLSERQSRILVESLVLGDGHYGKGVNGIVRYDSSSVKLINDFERLCFHSGWTGKISLHGKAGTVGGTSKGKQIISTVDSYRYTINKFRHNPRINGNKAKHSKIQKEEIVHFKGKVYCFNVPNNVFYVKKNSKPYWTGNSSRSGQKGICGMMYDQYDMPFTESGMTPDLIMNPQAYPSRMTCGQLMELIAGKSAAINGTIMDATPFTNITVKSITDELKKFGYDEYGKEKMYNPYTGEPFEAMIFYGPTYYQRLKHMVIEKIHARATGGVTMLTRQPQEGRARDGGLRFGEMEKDSQLAHGSVQFLKERFYECSDKYSIYLCNVCGNIAYGNVQKSFYDCTTCKNLGRIPKIVKVNIPYASKLLVQEIQSMNFNMKLFTE